MTTLPLRMRTQSYLHIQQLLTTYMYRTYSSRQKYSLIEQSYIMGTYSRVQNNSWKKDNFQLITPIDRS